MWLQWPTERRRVAARELARWEELTFFTDRRSALVVVRKVARVGRWVEVVDQQFLGSVAIDLPDYAAQLVELELKAASLAVKLNAGAVT